MRFLKIGYHDCQCVVLDLAEQASLVKDLGQGEGLILRNHGALTMGRSVGEAFNLENAVDRFEPAGNPDLPSSL